MSLLSFQQALLEIYCNKQSLDEFVENPARFMETFELSEKEKRALNGISKEELVKFNEELRQKQSHIAQSLLTDAKKIAVLPFSYTGTPVLMFSPDMSREISNGMFMILDHLNLKTVSYWSLFKSYVYQKVNSPTPVYMNDLFGLFVFIRRNGGWGKTACVL